MTAKLPTANETVCFVLPGGAIRYAKIDAPWGGADPMPQASALAAKFGRNVEDVIAEHQYRATLHVSIVPGDLIPDPGQSILIVKNAEHDPAGKRPGCWFRAEEVSNAAN